ncbi:hypothetical protein Sste5346_002078 [Sporothrix stenoceras]|uniref:Peptidase S53 domain-containing protein n=1 Tax=Sporothrix stenoceras TaxID=5173 RepID=A0ABR3ZKT9_9PEZI
MAYSTLRSGMATLAAIATTVMLLPGTNAAVVSKIDAVPAGWTAVGSSTAKTFKTENTNTGTDSSDTHVFTIALNMQNIDQLESRLLAVSTPGNADYGKFSDVDDITSTFGPSDAAVSAVTSWLESSGVVKGYAVRGAFVDLATDVAGANTLFGANYQYYTPPSTAVSTSTKLRTLSYSVPDEIAEHVALVDPGNYFGAVRSFAPRLGDLQFAERAPPTAAKAPSKATTTTIDAACQTSITPACLKQLYQVGDYEADAKSGSRIGFGSFLNQSALYADLADYLTLNGLPSQNFTVELINNATNDQNPATAQIGEADLDAQNIVGVAHPLPVVEFITGGAPPFVPNIDQPTAADNQNEPYLPYYRYLHEQSNSELPQVISNSYGDEEDSVPYNYAVLTCNLIGLLGLRGITVIESSGDLGVGAGCLAPDNKTPEFNAIFPATCPYLTSVGGTVDVTPEIAWEGSSGGFSKYFPRPAYQALAVGAYLAEHVSASTYKYYSAYTNWNGRGFPDVSAHSVSPDYQIVYAGKPGPSGGTSAAAPVWAALVGLLNDARLRQGLPTLGWLNPLIYTFGPEVLTDITAGQAIGCDGQNTQSGGAEPAGSGIIPGAFWNATTGWDPVTGYGTPNFGKLLSLVTGF